MARSRPRTTVSLSPTMSVVGGGLLGGRVRTSKPAAWTQSESTTAASMARSVLRVPAFRRVIIASSPTD
jgi:hypothetical protein